MKYTEYENFESLRKHEEGHYLIEPIPRHSPIVIIAPHAGKIEPHTGKIARKIARNDYSLYRFIGERKKFKKHPDDGRMQSLHLCSYKFDEPDAVRLVKSHKVALAVHGLQNDVADKFQGLDIYVGGLNADAREKVVANLKREKFEVVDCTKLEDFRHKGQDSKNIVNLCKGVRKGVQLEITKRERRKLVRDEGRMELFCNAIREALDSLV
jgi:phage replication-related protein YjqB (UPF0714/DUF867 family)